jgi:hypothetical protein
MSTVSTVSISEETVRATLLGSEGNHKKLCPVMEKS